MRAELELKILVGAAGVEPATLGLEIRCSIRLSYAPVVRKSLQDNISVPELPGSFGRSLHIYCTTGSEGSFSLLTRSSNLVIASTDFLETGLM
jgi:hypothetical protein